MKIAVRTAFAIVLSLEFLGPFALPDIATDFTWLGLIVTTIFSWGILEFFRASALLLGIAFVAVILDAAGALLELYSRIEPWDLWIHAVGGGVIATATLELLRRALKEGRLSVRDHKLFLTTAVYLATTTVGFLYEFWEYVVDKLQYGYPKSLVSAYDSVEDQVLNLLGATLVLAIYLVWQAKFKRPASQ
ncbi:MAG: hypothetical protein A2855_02100 [Candidatus Liptonbacteria bacterium RIFCSPHIGHO2_01_FULL_57_28]|uniref:DUF2238 domain-containing protein n=1 Tax=Candidatus Liptonbacteria bacterium RIFCSPHIGHO2_01_FULL_57_28 TaxID=1798647 RepID=A0A1G2CD80_9BACT|nr:MAG: hypothetical protein A2855_02100 [Candidatus Liptonbacteria bacterium RIFCSPHIGHO2_01_FULL_57_28]